MQRLDARWVIGFRNGSHSLIEDGSVVFDGAKISYVGPRMRAPDSVSTVAYGDALICPGFISTHAHIGAGSGDRMITDGGRRDLQRTGFLNYLPTRLGGGPAFGRHENLEASTRFGFASLLRHGTTTVVEMGGGGPNDAEIMLAAADACGIRLYYAPRFNGGRYFVDAAGRIVRELDENAGFAGLAEAIRFIERQQGNANSRFNGILVPSEAVNCSIELLKETQKAAADLGVRWTTHIAEQVWEFHETLRSSSKTPVMRFADADLLDQNVILGHCRYIGTNGSTAYPYGEDLEVLAASRAHVAHSPLAGARRGSALESLQKYLDAGVRMCIGTDVYPLDIIMEMTFASLVCKIVDGRSDAAQSGAVFSAATVGGANALGRDDLGRLAAGAKADIVVCDFSQLRTGPVLDPVRTLINCGNGDLVKDVFVDGRKVVDGGEVVAWERDGLMYDVRASSEKVWAGHGDFHWAGQSVEDLYPSSFPTWCLDDEP
jgi:5-methylthioadenosine/S-adenosylhomocysteine deaminase